MDGWKIGRLLTAAEFEGNYVNLRLAIMSRGDDPFLYLQIVPDRDVSIDPESYARWSTRCRAPVPENWEPHAGNPWRLCRYSGPLRTSSAADIDELIDGIPGVRETTVSGLFGLIDAHLDAPTLPLKDRRVLLQFLQKDLASTTLTTLVRPDRSEGKYDLSLVAAWEIHRAVDAEGPLTEIQLRQADLLLRYAPWNLGYWGPFKALVKAVPAEDLADAYAVAIARLSAVGREVSVPKAISIESHDDLESWFGIPSAKTRQYLARRARRDLAALAQRSPDVYARVASRLLMSWDQPLSNYSYAPAFVMLGATSPLDDRSRYVRRPAGMAARRDAHPEIWDARPQLAGEVFTSIRSSVEALTWAAQVLDAAGSVLALSGRAIPLALASDYAPLRRLGCEALPGQPAVTASLTADQWLAFFEHASADEIDHVARELAGETLGPHIGEALVSVFSQPDDQSGLHGRLAQLYLAAPKGSFTKHADADVAAVIAAIKGSGIEQQPLWGPVAARLGPWNLAKVYWALADDDVDTTGLEAIAVALLANQHHPADLILECIGSTNEKITDLGWRLVDSHGSRTFLFDQLLPSAGPGERITAPTALRVVKVVLPRAQEPREVGELITWGLTAGVRQSSLAKQVSPNPLAPRAIWDAVGIGKNWRVADFAEKFPKVTRLVGDEVTGADLTTARPDQLKFILRYVTENPERIAEDTQFGIDAANSTDTQLRAAALQQLRESGHLPQVWSRITETGLPEGIDTARQHLESLTDSDHIRDAITQALESQNPAVREIGLELYRSHGSVSKDPAVLAALARSNDQRTQDIVAEAAESGSHVDESVLQDFDHRILTDQQSSPRARESVRRRIETSDVSGETASPERVAALLQLARGTVKKDREWALMRLATMALHGVQVEGLEVSLTTEGMVSLEDVAP